MGIGIVPESMLSNISNHTLEIHRIDSDTLVPDIVCVFVPKSYRSTATQCFYEFLTQTL